MEIISLPIELWWKILGLLPLKDKLRARRVCKQLRFIADNLPDKSLIIARDHYSENYIRNWFHNHRPIDRSNTIYYGKNGQIFDSNLFTNRFFGNLKMLHLAYEFYKQPAAGTETENVNEFYQKKQPTFLNHFQALETLFINTSCGSRTTNWTKIELPELKNLAIRRISPSTHTGLSFDCPKLRLLLTINFDNFQIVHPETVRHIRTVNAGKKVNQLKAFVNLEHLDDSGLDIFEPKNLEHLRRLIGQLNSLKWINLRRPNTKEKLNKLRRLVNEKSIQVYLDGLEIDRWLQLSSYPKVPDQLRFHLANEPYLLLPEAWGHIWSIKYETWQELVEDRAIPVNFESRLFNLHLVEVVKPIARTDRFLKFIVSCNVIQSLVLIDSGLTDEFYSKLPSILPHLLYLKMIDELDRLMQVDFDFLFKLDHLRNLCVNYPLDFSFIKRLILHNRGLQWSFHFSFEGQCVSIEFWKSTPSNLFLDKESDLLKQFEEELNEELKSRSRQTVRIRFTVKQF